METQDLGSLKIETQYLGFRNKLLTWAPDRKVESTTLGVLCDLNLIATNFGQNYISYVTGFLSEVNVMTSRGLCIEAASGGYYFGFCAVWPDEVVSYLERE